MGPALGSRINKLFPSDLEEVFPGFSNTFEASCRIVINGNLGSRWLANYLANATWLHQDISPALFPHLFDEYFLRQRGVSREVRDLPEVNRLIDF
jgi:hypothetical protein